MPNLRADFTTMACLLASPAIFTSELLAEGVAPVPLDGSTMVEGTYCPTAASSPDANIRGILATGLEKTKHKISESRTEVLDYSRLATYLLLVVCDELLRFLAAERVLV